MNLCDQLSPHLLWRCGAIKTTYPDFKLLWRNQQEIQYDGFLFFFLFKKRKKKHLLKKMHKCIHFDPENFLIDVIWNTIDSIL